MISQLPGILWFTPSKVHSIRVIFQTPCVRSMALNFWVMAHMYLHSKSYGYSSSSIYLTYFKDLSWSSLLNLNSNVVEKNTYRSIRIYFLFISLLQTFNFTCHSLLLWWTIIMWECWKWRSPMRVSHFRKINYGLLDGSCLGRGFDVLLILSHWTQ